MASWTCPQCGLVNFDSDQTCKTCHTPKINPAQTTPLSGGIMLEDGYVVPPPPSFGGVWREGATLVMAKDTPLPDFCVRCDAPAEGFRLRRNFSWHHPGLYILVLVAWLIYLIVALSVRKQATVYLGLCQQHYQKRRNLLTAGWIAFAVSIITAVVGFGLDYPSIGLIGIMLVAASIIFLVLAARTVNVKKIDDRYIWLNGFDEKYLARFPDVPR